MLPFFPPSHAVIILATFCRSSCSVIFVFPPVCWPSKFSALAALYTSFRRVLCLPMTRSARPALCRVSSVTGFFAAFATLSEALPPPWFSRSAKYTRAAGSDTPTFSPCSTYAYTSFSARSSWAFFPASVTSRLLITCFSWAFTVRVFQFAAVVIS